MAIKVELDEHLERKFRELAMRKYGYSKGSIRKAAESAIRLDIGPTKEGCKRKTNEP